MLVGIPLHVSSGFTLLKLRWGRGPMSLIESLDDKSSSLWNHEIWSQNSENPRQDNNEKHKQCFITSATVGPAEVSEQLGNIKRKTVVKRQHASRRNEAFCQISVSVSSKYFNFSLMNFTSDLWDSTDLLMQKTNNYFHHSKLITWLWGCLN